MQPEKLPKIGLVYASIKSKACTWLEAGKYIYKISYGSIFIRKRRDVI
jgi:hypothetical protein